MNNSNLEKICFYNRVACTSSPLYSPLGSSHTITHTNKKNIRDMYADGNVVYWSQSPPWQTRTNFFVYYEVIKWELKRRPIYECRYDERLKVKVEGSTRLTYIGFRGGLEHLKIETRLVDENWIDLIATCKQLVWSIRIGRNMPIWVPVCECDGWVCDLEATGDVSIFKLIRKAAALVRMLSTLDLSCEENAVRR
jgi:hypothetical protein